LAKEGIPPSFDPILGSYKPFQPQNKKMPTPCIFRSPIDFTHCLGHFRAVSWEKL
jgi:hypothetical protein